MADPAERHAGDNPHPIARKGAEGTRSGRGLRPRRVTMPFERVQVVPTPRHISRIQPAAPKRSHGHPPLDPTILVELEDE